MSVLMPFTDENGFFIFAEYSSLKRLPSLRLIKTEPNSFAVSSTDEKFCRASEYV
jgi:hypothetical protein